MVRMRVTKVSLVDAPATGEDFLVYKAHGEAEGQSRPLALSDVPGLAAFAKSEPDRGPALSYDAGAVMRMLGSIGRNGPPIP